MKKQQISEALIQRIRQLIPEVTTILLFGSSASGQADSASDNDILILTTEPLTEERKHKLKAQLRAEFAQLELDLIVSSEQTLIASLPYEPARRFWLEDAVLLWGRWPVVASYPPLSKGALLSHLTIIASEIDLGEVEETTLAQATVGLDALEHLLHLKLALENNYRNSVLRAEMEQLLGPETVQTIRLTPERITPVTLKKLYDLLRQIHHQLEKTVEALPENSIDLAWKESWGINESAETPGVGSSISR